MDLEIMSFHKVYLLVNDLYMYMSHILYDLLLPSMIKCQISSPGLILMSGPFSLNSKSSLILVLM